MKYLDLSSIGSIPLGYVGVFKDYSIRELDLVGTCPFLLGNS